jgi:hypothetical protein
MNPFQTTKSNLLMCCIIAGTLSISTGCKLGFPSNKTSLTQPQSRNFKFWETEDKLSASEDSKTPPPPARHFSPSPLDPTQEDIVMDLKSPPAGLGQPMGNINDLRREVTEVSENTANPIRKPYQLTGSSNATPTSPNESLDSFAGRDLPQVKTDGFAGQFKNNNDFASSQNSSKNRLQPNPGFKAPTPKAPVANQNMLPFGGSLSQNPAFQFNGGKSKTTQPGIESSSTPATQPLATQKKSELLIAQEQLRALQNKNLIRNPNQQKLSQDSSTNLGIKNPSQSFVKPNSPKLTPNLNYPSTDFDSFAQKPVQQKSQGLSLPPNTLDKSLGSNGKSSPPQAFKLPKAQQIPPSIDSFESKSAVRNTSNEVDLPPSILSGNSSYAPGSTKKLLPK